MNGLFLFLFVGLVNLKLSLYGFETVFLWFTAEISHLNEILVCILTVKNCQRDRKPLLTVGSSAGGAAVGMFPLCSLIPFTPSDRSPVAFHQELPNLMERKPKTCTVLRASAQSLRATRSRHADERGEPRRRLPSLCGLSS